MRLVTKLALALVAGVFVVVAVFTALRVRGELELFDEDARRDQRLIAVTASAALAQSRTREDAIRLARRVDASRENMEIHFVSFAAGSKGPLAPVVSREAGLSLFLAELLEPPWPTQPSANSAHNVIQRGVARTSVETVIRPT